MIVYHGSYIEIKMPDLLHSRLNVDFGRAFYTTPIYEQAVRWCGKFKTGKGTAVISRYNFDECAAESLKVLRFERYSEEWLNFILECRMGNEVADYDIVVGGVANDRVFNTVELYFANLIDEDEAIKRLRFEKPNLQIAFRSSAALGCLKFEGSDLL